MRIQMTSVPSSGQAANRTAWARLASALPWLSLMIVILLTSSILGLSSGPTAVTLALLGVLHSASGFYRHGGPRITPPGVLLFGMLIFGYFPTLYYAWVEQEFTPVSYEVRGLVALLAFQFGLYPLWSVTDRRVPDMLRTTAPASAWVPGVSLGVASLLGGVLISALEIAALWPLAQPAGYGGVVLIALSVVQARRRVNFLVLLLIASLFAIFVVLLFTGGGRIVLGSLGLALAMATGFVWRPAFVKPVILAALPPVLAILARVRADSVANPFTGYQESGVESVVRPQRLFFKLIEDSRAGYIVPGNGETFLASAVSWVPREFWTDKPVGLGTTLTQLYRPDLLSVGHSEAGLLHGEFVYNFGLWGLVLGTLVVGFAVWWLDVWVTALHELEVRSTSTLIVQALGITLTAGMVDLVWVGTFTYVARAGFTCAVLGILWVVAKTLRLDERQVAGDVPSPSTGRTPIRGTNRDRIAAGCGTTCAHPR